MAGYAFTWAQSPERSIVYSAVRPDLRRRGIGSRLMDAALFRSVEVGSVHATSAVGVSNEAAMAFLSVRGFTVAGENRFMRAGAEVDSPGPVWPSGYAVRDFASVGDLNVLADALNGSYGDMWGHTENAPGTVDAGYLAREIENRPELHDPHGVFLAFGPDGDVAGVVAAFRRPAGDGMEPELVIDSPGVIPRHRSLGLQRQLTLTAMRWLRADDQVPVALETFGDSPEAFGIYAALGFEIEARFIDFCKKLR
jgi:mycothiol synthase